MTYVRPNIHINKQTSPIFNCVTSVSVSLATLARQQYVETANSEKKMRAWTEGVMQLIPLDLP